MSNPEIQPAKPGEQERGEVPGLEAALARLRAAHPELSEAALRRILRLPAKAGGGETPTGPTAGSGRGIALRTRRR